ncbi:putative phage abortive infection protein [Parabacteroides sp. Marseille-P3160]|uniref:putative phage abortive infection protein n=1 Tax=Parabacteroides sp. Marseille-P3160 TaxID=1917887 RepID=UPI00135CDD7E|nr:putative phage abortive infection protein [Parabacteroides sp. Marseille-P3160]
MKKIIIIMIAIGIVFALIAPFVFTRTGLACLDFRETGQIGDTIGGITAPIIGILSVILLFYTLWEQIVFNKKQKEISSNEQFKTTFFNLLQVQREILEKIAGHFSYLGNFVYEEYPETNNKIKITRKDQKTNIDKEIATINNQSNNRERKGIQFFKSARYQLILIFESLDSDRYTNNYNAEDAYNAETDLQGEIHTGWNIPPEVEKEQDELIHKTRKPFRNAYINDKYSISDKAYNTYKELPIDKQLGFGYAYFFYKYEVVGYYFRHLYNILKYIKTNEDEKIYSLGKKASNKKKQEVHEEYKQYAQFIQAQMSIDELLILFYECFSFPKMKQLVIHYNLLDNLTIQNLIKKEHNCEAKIRLKNKNDLFTDIINR